jgi:hypothetical protein
MYSLGGSGSGLSLGCGSGSKEANYFLIHRIRNHNTGIKAFPVRKEIVCSPADFPQN